MTGLSSYLRRICKYFMPLAALCMLAACSTNPATGKSQFTALMSPQEEVQVGTDEHQKIKNQFGFCDDPKLQAYVQEVGRRVSQNTERPEVQYKFFILDSPIVNAFALPGGYVYVSRGLLALASSEAELAAVLAHETGHITARHSAERYSHSVITSLGASVLSAAVGNTGVSQALGLGSNLYLSSYSRTQENEADMLGIRYLSRGNYDPAAMSLFLSAMQSQSVLENKLQGNADSEFDYFSTHPATSERVANTVTEAENFPQAGDVGREHYLDMIDGLTYGDSTEQGFARDNSFYHPKMGFTFDVPKGFEIVNQPTQIVAISKPTGAVVLFDIMPAKGAGDPYVYLTQSWMQGQNLAAARRMSVNGLSAASAEFTGQVNGHDAAIHLFVVQWGANSFARFQVAIPKGAPAALQAELAGVAQSFRSLSEAEKSSLHPDHIRIITAQPGDTVSALARRQPFTQMQEERFRVMNGMNANAALVPGQRYKLVVR